MGSPTWIFDSCKMCESSGQLIVCTSFKGGDKLGKPVLGVTDADLRWKTESDGSTNYFVALYYRFERRDDGTHFEHHFDRKRLFRYNEKEQAGAAETFVREIQTLLDQKNVKRRQEYWEPNRRLTNQTLIDRFI